jgi:hypothetical protein
MLLDECQFCIIVEIVFDWLEEDQLQLFVVTTRLIWLRRNNWVFNREFQAPTVVMRHAQEQLHAYKDVELSKHVHNPVMLNPGVQRWTKPPYGIIKLN